MLFLHGTTISAACSIIKNGFQNVDTIWTCSDARYTYMVEIGNIYDEMEAVRFACEAAQIAAAKLNVYDTEIVIFGFDFPSDIAGKYLMPDISCANMDGCWCIENNTINKLIQNGEISYSAKIVQNAYIPYLRPFYLMHISQDFIDLDKDLKNIYDYLKNANISDIYDIIDVSDLCEFNALCDFA